MKQVIDGYIPEKCETLDDFPKIKGYDFNEKFDFNNFLKSFSTTGFQATNLAKAIEVIKTMRREKAKIFLAFTSNMVSSGVREVIKYLVEHKYVDVLITNAGGIEEDLMKVYKPFVLGNFDYDGGNLLGRGINATGNIFVPNDRYLYLDKEMRKFFDQVYELQKKKGSALCTSELIYEMGKFVDNEESILYWAYKNNLPVFSPAFTDGSIGDLVLFFKQRKPDFQIDISEDMTRIVNLVLHAEKTGVIALGGGSAKHYALNAQIFRDGCDYAVYVNTGEGFDGSDSGAKTNEAITWGKIKTNALQVKVHGDATILFPLIVAASFKKEEEN